MDEDNVLLDTPNEPVEPVIPEDTTPEEPSEPEVDVAQLQAANKKLYERAKKAETDLKTLKAQSVSPASPPANVEETVLLAQGLPDELLTELKVIAQLRKVSLIKAQTDPIFVAVKEKFEKEQKQKDASLPASRGSGDVKPKKDFTTPGLTREEHKAMVKALYF